ncbi:hypothetical protein FRB99_002848 [Tulasnella sp. 403]|nr:hypothetical protein FRB99_002848 [Tulasnella sp. 403]
MPRLAHFPAHLAARDPALVPLGLDEANTQLRWFRALWKCSRLRERKRKRRFKGLAVDEHSVNPVLFPTPHGGLIIVFLFLSPTSHSYGSGVTVGPAPPVLQVPPGQERVNPDTTPPLCRLSYFIDAAVYLFQLMPFMAPITNAITTLVCLSPRRNNDHNGEPDHPLPHHSTQPVFELAPLPPAYSLRYSPPPAPPYMVE